MNGAKEVVLKDIWLDRDAKTERQLQFDLFADIGAFIERTLPGEGVPQLKSSGPTFEDAVTEYFSD